MKLQKNMSKVLCIVLISFSLVRLQAVDVPGHTATSTHDTELNSPIDLSVPAMVSLLYKQSFRATIKVVCEHLPTQDLETEYMVQIDPAEKTINNNDIVVDGETYHLLQFHFHAPSEHTVNGKRLAAEVHFVHKSDRGAIVVVGVFITPGERENPEYKSILKMVSRLTFPKKEEDGKKLLLEEMINVVKLLPLHHAYVYRYLGAKTSGTLDPGVKWIILMTPLEFSKEQLKMLKSIESSGTKIHKLNGRSVVIGRIDNKPSVDSK